MTKKASTSRIQILELQVEEAVQMLRLAATNQRTCLEIQEWLDTNYPEDQGDAATMSALLNLQNQK